MRLYALKTARALGIRVRLDGDDLELEASLPPPSTVLDLLSRHKTDILRLLRPANDGWSPEDWQFFFDERASIAEFDGGMPRAEAESTRVRLLRDRMAQPQPHAVCIRTVPRLRRWGASYRSVAAVWERNKGSCLAASRMLAGMVSGARGRRYRGACRYGYRPR